MLAGRLCTALLDWAAWLVAPLALQKEFHSFPAAQPADRASISCQDQLLRLLSQQAATFSHLPIDKQKFTDVNQFPVLSSGLWLFSKRPKTDNVTRNSVIVLLPLRRRGSLHAYPPACIVIVVLEFPKQFQTNNQTLRRFGGRQPLCGIGVTSRISRTSMPADWIARTADSRPDPGPFTLTSQEFIPSSRAA